MRDNQVSRFFRVSYKSNIRDPDQIKQRKRIKLLVEIEDWINEIRMIS
jgi:hypothetical protein